ncbi:CsgG/HfaB family protein [Treponema primitia]|uniref:CsgG/HfaB family protein n=1 Tax=Treponema primitia TaxID=88058 RepID=UPI0002554F1A|nr:CsgG/HfaB family protein [Treponema primitia]
MQKISFLGIFLFCSFLAYTQEAITLDNAILDSVDFFSSKLPSGSTVAVTNFEAETKGLSDFIIQELLVAFANTGTVRVVERSRLEMLETELNFNMSGSVSDETAQGIGRMIGAQILFSGSIGQYRDMYRMRVQAIVIETAEVIGTRTINIKYDPTLTGLLGRINPADAWKYQWLYFGIGAGYSMIISEPEEYLEAYDWHFGELPLGFSVYAMVQPFDLFGIALDVSGNGYSGINILVEPTLIMRPSPFEVNVFFGPGMHIAFATPPEQTAPGFAFSGGLRGGVHIGPGVLFTEARVTGVLWAYDDYDIGYGAALDLSTNFCLGYKIGFIQRKK